MESPKSQNTPQYAKRATYTVRCLKCGYRSPPSHQFCVICGQVLSTPGLEVASPALRGRPDSFPTQPVGPVKRLPVPTPSPRSLPWADVVGGVLIIIGVIVLIAVVYVVMPLGLSPSPQSKNLPKGMETGYWAFSSGHFLDNGDCEWGVVFLDDQHFTGVEPGEFGTYTLVDENTVLVQASNWLEYIKVSVAKSGERIVVESEDGSVCLVDLAIRNTSSGNLSKEILGTWELYYELISLDDEFGSGYLWEFRRNGELIIKNQANREVETNGNYELIDSKLAIGLPGETRRVVYTVFSIGDLMFFRDSDGDNDLFMLRR